MMSSSAPLILALASGKGGVGKTMLTVACAYELSLAKRTLLVDLDFFNRGLSGLLREGRALGKIPPPSFLTNPNISPAEWSVVEVAPKLLHLVYPDLLPDELGRLESLGIEDMYTELCRFLDDVAAQYQCCCIVLDCHGGPDRTSFAAVLAADYTLLVSEPDRITFHGTFNFLRQLKRVTAPDPAIPEAVVAPNLAGSKPDVRLVFNKVLPALSVPFLRRTYDLHLRDEFDGKRLLAIFPLEVYLTKAFEQTPVLTAIYPYSLLARKMRVLLYDLLVDSRPDLLSRGILSIPRWSRNFRRETIGKTPLFLDHTFILGVIAVCAVLMMILISGRSQFQLFRTVLDRIDNWGETFLAFGLTWLGSAFLLLWSRLIDRSFVRAERSKRYFFASLHVPLAVGIWSLAVVIFVIMCLESIRTWNRSYFLTGYHGDTECSVLLSTILLGLLLMVPLFREPYFIYRERTSENHPVESLLRFLFLILLVTITGVAVISVLSQV